MFNAETAEPAEKVLLLLKATTKARRHEESQGAFRVFVSSWLHFSVSSAFTPRIFAGSSPDGDGSNRRTRAALDFQRLNDECELVNPYRRKLVELQAFHDMNAVDD